MASSDIFVSCVSDDFEKQYACYPGFRSALSAYLRRADCHVKVQEDFRQEGSINTVQKLADYIRGCQAVLHLLATSPGAVSDQRDREAFLNKEPEFLKNYPDLRRQLGDCSDLTYTQWEACLALHYGVNLFVYRTDDADSTQKTHLDRLASVHRYPERFSGDVDLLGKLIGDLRKILPNIPELKRQIANSRFLKHCAEDFLGREAELAFLDDFWLQRINVLSLIAWGGVGKTSLVVQWIQQRFIDREWQEDGAPSLWRYFDWSFYDQGTGSLDDDTAVRTGNVGDFFEEALEFFGDPDPKMPGKGKRLAELVRQQHSLLILDGLEPLQAPPNSYHPGQLLDPDLHDLLVALAQLNPGLCLLTSRQVVRDLAGLSGKAAVTKDLDELPKETAVRLLRKMQIKGTDKELTEACEKFDCHALSLTLLGRFLLDAHDGEIARIDRVNLRKADRLTRPERHRTAWRVLEAYDEWLNVAKADPTLLAVLRLVGLFDRPATTDCLRELRTRDIIPGLTDAIHCLDQEQWNILLRRLERAKLVRLRPSEMLPDESDVDAHPLVREYFAEQLRTRMPDAFVDAHSRLFHYLSDSTEYRPDTLGGLQPLYQAVTHGCLAQRHQEACDKIYRERIQRGGEAFSTKKLGALSADLGAVAAFFEEPWSRLSANLSEASQAWLFNEAAFSLRALGRLLEAVKPMQVGLQMRIDQEGWKSAATISGNLSELELTLGDLDAAVFDGRNAIAYADLCHDAFQGMNKRTTAADALHQQGGHNGEALKLFEQAERIQQEQQPKFPLLYSLWGYRYVDLLLSPSERAAWQCLLSRCKSGVSISEREATLVACRRATRRANKWFEWRMDSDGLLDIALDHLTLARAAMYRSILESEPSAIELGLSQVPGDPRHVNAGVLQILQHPEFIDAAGNLHESLNRLRKANSVEFLARGLLTAAMLESLRGDAGILQALAHLDEAQQIATRGPMPLCLADIHLTRARIAIASPEREGTSSRFAADTNSTAGKPDASALPLANIDAKVELAEARRLIEMHKYGRRMPEVEDAEASLLN